MNTNTNAETINIKPSRIAQIDIIKGIAIIGVIILHSIPAKIKMSTHAALHIQQAVPVFIVVFGFNSRLLLMRYSSKYTRDFDWRRYLSNRFSRIVLPLSLIWVLSLVIGIGMKSFLKDDVMYFGPMLLFGRLPYRGPGNYYISVIIQLVIIAPILLSLYEKNKKLALIGIFLVDLAFQLGFGSLSIVDEATYEYICTRFLFMMVLGFWLHDHMDLFSKNNIWLLLLSTFSIVYLVSFGNTEFSYFRGGMNNYENLLASFYTAALVLTLLNILPKEEKNITSRFVAKCGRLSWQIFLVQIVYFPIIRYVVDYPNVFKGHDVSIQMALLIVYLSLNISFCYLLGYALQRFENKYLRL